MGLDFCFDCGCGIEELWRLLVLRFGLRICPNRLAAIACWTESTSRCAAATCSLLWEDQETASPLCCGRLSDSIIRTKDAYLLRITKPRIRRWLISRRKKARGWKALNGIGALCSRGTRCSPDKPWNLILGCRYARCRTLTNPPFARECKPFFAK